MEKKIFNRNCPQCSSEIMYANIKNRNRAENKKKLCRECVHNNKKEKNRELIKKYLTDREEVNVEIEKIFEIDNTKRGFIKKVCAYLYSEETKKILCKRTCPSCDLVIIHTTIYGRKQCEGRVCFECSRKVKAERGKTLIGEKNPFYGKKHSQESISKRLETLKTSDSWEKQLKYRKSDEFRQMMSEKMSGDNSPRKGLGSLKQIWISKLGEEDGLKRWDEWREKQREGSSGENNPMYGKPSPTGSGNGWSGWYKGWYFRSLRELSYMIMEIERKSLSWEDGELKKNKIQYTDWDGKVRNYFPDFIIEGKIMVECKPLNLHDSKSVQCKKQAAEEFCKQNNLTYLLVEPEILSQEEIISLYQSNQIKFLPRYEEKFIKKFLS